MFPVRTIPVELAAPFAAEKDPPLLFPGGIICSINLLHGSRPQHCIAQLTPAHHEPSDDQPAIDQLPDLLHHLVTCDKDRMLLSSHRKLRISREQDAVLLEGEFEKQGILLSISLDKPIGTYRIISHEPEVPAECTEHPIGNEPWFRNCCLVHDERSRS